MGNSQRKQEAEDRYKNSYWNLFDLTYRPLKDGNNNVINKYDATDIRNHRLLDDISQSNSGINAYGQAFKTANSINVADLNKRTEERDTARAENEKLKGAPQGDYAVLFTTVKKENEQIDKQIKELSDSYSTDNQKANYQSEKILTLKRINYVLFILYYMALLILTLVLFMYNTTMTKQKKVVIIVLLMIFPFISDILYQLLEYIYKFIYATLNGNAYTANNYSGK
jgi:hypothetical protein